jgi:hypothetical protein
MKNSLGSSPVVLSDELFFFFRDSRVSPAVRRTEGGQSLRLFSPGGGGGNFKLSFYFGSGASVTINSKCSK